MTGERISSFVLILLALYILKESATLGIGGLQQPKAGFFPMVGGLLLLVFSAIVFIKSLAAKSVATGEKPSEEQGSVLSAVYTVAGIIVYAIALEHVGFLLATFALVILLLWLFEHKKWWVNVLIAGLISSAFYVLFAVVLKAELPKGFLDLVF